MSLHSLRKGNNLRGPKSSKEFNEQVENTRKDIKLLYSLLNNNEREIYETTDIILNENFQLQKRISELESEVRKLENLIISEEEVIYNYTNFYNSTNLIQDTEEPAYLNREYGVIMPAPTSTTNKLSHLTDSERTVIPRDLEIVIEEENAKEFRSVELEQKMKDAGLQGGELFSDKNEVPKEGFSKIVDKKRDTYWTRQVASNEHLELFGRIVIRVPKEGVTNLFSNTLKVSPYPEGSMTIHSIMVKGLGNQWDLLDNYPTLKDEPLPIKNARKLMFNFPRKEITEIVINFSQPYYLENNEDKIFTYGFQGIDLEYNLFTEKETSFITELDISNEGLEFDEVFEPKVVFDDGSSREMEYLVEHELYYDENLTTEFTFNNNILTPVSKVYVKTILKRDGEHFPVLKEIQNSYTVK